MKGTDILRLQLGGSLNLVRERIDGLSDEEWNQRALPGTSKLGFILWHCSRIVDWTVHSALHGAPEVADRAPWTELFPPEAFYGAGIPDALADTIPATVPRLEVQRYVGDVREAVMSWLDGQTDSSLDAIIALRRHQEAHPGYLDPPVWAEVESLDGLPAWQILGRPAVSHVRVHVGEYDVLLKTLRARARREVEA